MKPKKYEYKDHNISLKQIDPDALIVIEKLQSAGFEAYIVGGSIRDLLLGKKPKDYDIATSAHPYQVKKLFRRCFIVGRRFRLAHVLIGKKLIEVATFRKGEQTSKLVLSDNTWGTPEEDAIRRDFTINGLFHNPKQNIIIDFVDGFKDIKKSLLKVIGIPKQRFLQDPVRMIRLLKFQGKFNLKTDAKAIKTLKTCKKDILKSAPARILEEIFKILESGSAKPIFDLLQHHGFIKLILPWLKDFSMLETVDQHIKNKKIPRPTLLASLIFPILELGIEQNFLNKNHTPNLHEIMLLTNLIIDKITNDSFAPIPKKLRTQLSYILKTQYRLNPLSNKIKKNKIPRHPEIKNALLLLELREQHSKKC